MAELCDADLIGTLRERKVEGDRGLSGDTSLRRPRQVLIGGIKAPDPLSPPTPLRGLYDDRTFVVHTVYVCNLFRSSATCATSLS